MASNGSMNYKSMYLTVQNIKLFISKPDTGALDRVNKDHCTSIQIPIEIKWKMCWYLYFNWVCADSITVTEGW